MEDTDHGRHLEVGHITSSSRFLKWKGDRIIYQFGLHFHRKCPSVDSKVRKLKALIFETVKKI